MTRRILAVAALAPILLGACASSSTTRQSTSVVRFLHPDRAVRADTSGIPVLRLPLRIGIAFVPEPTSDDRHHSGHFRQLAGDAIPESKRIELMKSVTDHFRKQPFIKSVEHIPTAYLAPGGGYENLDQLRQMFDIDVMVLLAYDQVQFTSETKAAITYLTLLGAYVIEGEKNDTRTLMDAVVVDIASRRVLFRAPGTSLVKAHASPIDLPAAQLTDRRKGFEFATIDLRQNLDASLAAFKEKVREAPPEELQVVRTAEFDRRAAASGAGSADVVLLVLGTLAAIAACRRRTPGRTVR
jgi:rhombotail lipoprotein